MTAAKKEDKVEDVEMKDAEEEKAGKNCISTIDSKVLLPFPAQPLTLKLALMDMFMKVEKKDPNLLSVEDVREHCKLIRRSVETKEVLLQKMICFYSF